MKNIKNFKIFEGMDETSYQEIQKMIDNNQFLKGKVKADSSTVFEAGDFILLLSDLSHITDAHVDETIPGSKFEKGVDLKKAIIGLVSNNKPTEMTKGFGPSESKVTNPEEAEKFKWLGLDSKTNVGLENVNKLDPNSEEFKSMNVYTYKDSRGNEFKIKVKEGEGEKTTFLSFIGAKLGKLGDKIVLSVMTAFPGKNGASVSNRNDFMKQGYYFTTTSKEIIEKSSSIAESKNSMKYIKTFESFKIFENIEEAEINTDDDELNGIYCVDFTPSELKKDEIIYNILVDVDENEHRWAKNTDEVEVHGMASKSTPSKYKVISNDGKEVKIEEIK